jgi:hypothetical protein
LFNLENIEQHSSRDSVSIFRVEVLLFYVGDGKKLLSCPDNGGISFLKTWQLFRRLHDIIFRKTENFILIINVTKSHTFVFFYLAKFQN